VCPQPSLREFTGRIVGQGNAPALYRAVFQRTKPRDFLWWCRVTEFPDRPGDAPGDGRAVSLAPDKRLTVVEELQKGGA
jgi:hypothetical protein